MDKTEYKILSLLGSGFGIDMILKELNTDEGSLADIIIELDIKDLIVLEDKNWILTEKGKDILKEMKVQLKKLKVDYLYGSITKEEFQKRKIELESIINIEKPIEDKVEEIKIEEKKISCSRCGKENKIGSKFCYKCGEQLKRS